MSERYPVADRRGGAPTRAERAALRTALEMGYFDVTRAATLVDVADELDLTDVEVSHRIRQGIEKVVQPTNDREQPVVVTAGSVERTSLDQLFDVLSHPYRRRILTLLGEHTPGEAGEFTVEDLATDDDDLDLLTSALYHVHLPKLAGAGYIDVDEDRMTIRRGPSFDAVAPLLRVLADHRDELPVSWP